MQYYRVQFLVSLSIQASKYYKTVTKISIRMRPCYGLLPQLLKVLLWIWCLLILEMLVVQLVSVWGLL